MQEKLNAVIEECREDAERKELEAKCQQVFDYISSVGLDPEEWQSPVSAIAGTTETKRKPKGGVRKAKYIFEDENGKTRTWSGNGKIPLALQKQLNEGCPLETFLIEKPSQHEQSE
ncbi:global nucleic acid-binding transcriptional dual regulator [Escherichia coli]|nr:global nucleic acid-binding transcriptional dual regulator [Escherichia coli]